MGYESMKGPVFLEFLKRLVADAPRKILLVVDRLQAHKTPDVQAWLEDNKEKMEVFLLPAYSPELNPVEYLNNDMKGQINKSGMPDDKAGLRSRLAEYMLGLASLPALVASFFLHPCVQYASALFQ